MAHQMQIEKERRDMRRWARFAGTDIAAFSETEVDEGEPVKAIPLSAVLNPEAFNRLVNTYSGGEESFIEDDEYERQAAALEKAGLMTEIDSLVVEAETKAKGKKAKLQKDKDENTLDANLGFLKDVDELTNKAEQLANKKRRPRIIR